MEHVVEIDGVTIAVVRRLYDPWVDDHRYLHRIHSCSLASESTSLICPDTPLASGDLPQSPTPYKRGDALNKVL